MNSIAELVSAYQADKLKLAALFDALGARGAVSEAQHHAEQEWLEQQRDAGALDPMVAKALLAKLASVQASPAGASQDDDVTQVKPATQRPAPSAPAAPPSGVGSDDATRVQPASRPPAPPPDDVTVVKPASRPVRPPAADDEATMVKPASAAPREPTEGQTVGATGTQGTRQGMTGTSSSMSSSSWNHIAEGDAPDFVTVGSLLKGRFYLEKEIGRGGMGVVFKARDERKVEARDRDPYVAVKILNDEFRRHPDSLISLQRESRRSQQLAHDNIVRVYDFDKDRTIVFMTMEYVDGSDLKQLIREKAYNGMPLAQARPLIEGMARALTRAHSAGVVHSDFKPANVMVTREGVPKVFDFGIARAGKHMGDAVGEQTVFDAGTLGALTPAYASLEMIRGEDPVPSDDVYALGCVTFELLTGKHPYDKASAEVAMKEGRKPPPVKGLTKHQYKTLCASVAFTKAQRLKSANELIEGLRDVGARERALPYLLYGVPAILVIAGGAWAWTTYQRNHHLAEVIARFTMTRADHYADEGQALQALDTLNDDDRKRTIIDQGELIQSYLLGRIDAYWNPARDRYDYAGTQKVFKLRDDLKLYSPALDIKRTEVEKQRNDLLNSLDTKLTDQIGADAIFENQPDNVVTTLTRIRAIDPNSALLKNAELELKYDTAIGKSIDAGRVDEATVELKLASSLFPDSARLKQRSAQLDEIGKALAAQRLQEQKAQALQQQREQGLQTLTALLDQPVSADDWRAKAATAYHDAASLLGDDPRLAAQTARLKDVLAAQAKERQGAGDLPGAISIAGFGIDLFPGDASLTATRQALLEQQNQLAQKAASEAQRTALAKSRVTDLLANPQATVVWLQDVRSALNTARTQIGADSPDYAAVKAQADAGLIKLARDQIAGGNLDAAERVGQAGQQIDPAEAGFARVLADVAASRSAAQQKTLQQQAQALADARTTLASLGAKPTLTPDWQRDVATAMATLGADKSPETERAVNALGAAIAAEAARLADPQHLPQARIAVDFGLKYVPKSAELIAQGAALDALQQQLQAKAAQEGADAEVKSRIESMKSAVAAGDVSKASQSLARIRTLQPDNPFLKTEGPKLLADAYLGQAEDAFQKGRYQRASDVLGQGLGTLGNNAGLRAAKARYDVVAAIMAASKQPLGSAEYAQLQKQLDSVRRNDATELGKLETSMKARGQLTARSLAEQLDKLKRAAVAAPAPQVTAPVSTPVTEAPVPTPGRPPVTTGKTGTTPVVQPAPSGGVAAAGGPDPCAKPGLAGKGKFCSDAINGGRGPLLVVVPGVNGGKAYAISRAEISINEFNQFCRSSGKCAAVSVADKDLGNAPISNISLDQARAYARWLSDLSGGFTYRLPTDAEWLHAAKGGGGWKQAEDSNCILPSAGGGDGGGAAVSPRGRSRNPWGLVNSTGNVWEWVVSGGSVMVRGGSYSSYWSDCSVDSSRADGGSPQRDVGFRILRELK
ncbi:bifunctional serine/threonine-protein kinase/formylglycine-generating enzyme family protein [Rhodanobacter sp. IGA1.0]|uniref:Bifunctional serine/threonine-protein kinase/formylglycine-generating enzyme family protein n=1 Tax=Rhodanobacter sp. IGA1.0 TaxID=3158582 RepID=A0AAU7QI60_9GAMM